MKKFTKYKKKECQRNIFMLLKNVQFYCCIIKYPHFFFLKKEMNPIFGQKWCTRLRYASSVLEHHMHSIDSYFSLSRPLKLSYIKEKYLNLGICIAPEGISWTLQRLCMVILYENDTSSSSEKIDDDDFRENLNNLLYEIEATPDDLISKIENLLSQIVQFKKSYYQNLIKNIEIYGNKNSKNYKCLDANFENFNLWMAYELAQEYLRLVLKVEAMDSWYEA